MNTLRRRWFIVTLFFLIVVRLLLPPIGLYGINWALKNKLGQYDGKVDDFDLSLHRGAYQLQGLEFKKKNSDLPPILTVDEIDLSIAFRTLFRGEINADVVLQNAKIQIIDSKTDESKQLGNDEPGWQQALGVLVPITVESLKIEDSSLIFSNSDLSKTKPVKLDKIYFVAGNLHSRDEGSDDLLSPIEGSAILQDHAKLKIDGGIDALAKKPRYDINASIVDFHPKNINELLLTYVPLDLTAGQISVYAEAASSGGDLIGYAKLFLKDIDVIAPDQKLHSPKHFIFEIGSAFANWALKNHKDNTVATLIPFSKMNGKFNMDTSEAFWSAVKNKSEELKRGFDNSIDIKKIEKGKNKVSSL